MPEIKSVNRETLSEFSDRTLSWVILFFSICLGVGVGILDKWKDFEIIIIPSAIMLLSYLGYLRGKARLKFWKMFAEINGWQYKGDGDPRIEQGLMFKQGRDRRIKYEISGVIDGRNLRIFSYDFSIGSGKQRKTYCYTVFAFMFAGSFPQIYLNNRRNSYSIKAGEELPLPAEFGKNFILSAPKDYEIEALEIFTPEVMAKIIDNEFNHDVEFANHEAMIFAEGFIGNMERLKEEFNKALRLENLFDEKLDKFKFAPVGDMPYSL